MPIYDPGSVVPLQLQVTNSSGSLANAGTVTVAITLPDGTNSGALIPSNPQTGVYTYAYPATESGIYQVAWLATGTNACAFNDVFEVLAPQTDLIVSVADALEVLNMTGLTNATAYVPRLRTYIAAITKVIENVTGPILPRQYDEWYDGGATSIQTNHAPLVAVPSLVEEVYSVNVVHVLTNEPLDQTVVDAYGYTVDLETGTLYRRVSGMSAPFYPGKRNIRITYTAGQANVPPNVRAAALELLRIHYQPAIGGNRPGLTGPAGVDADEDMAAESLGEFIPWRVMEMLLPSQSTFGIA